MNVSFSICRHCLKTLAANANVYDGWGSTKPELSTEKESKGETVKTEPQTGINSLLCAGRDPHELSPKPMSDDEYLEYLRRNINSELTYKGTGGLEMTGVEFIELLVAAKNMSVDEFTKLYNSYKKGSTSISKGD
jgi:hypothetical protein